MLLGAAGVAVYALAGVVVTAILGVLTFIASNRATSARTAADTATNRTAETDLLVRNALEMADQARAEAASARERAGMAEARSAECHGLYLACEAERHRQDGVIEQLQAEVDALAGILRTHLPSKGEDDPRPHRRRAGT